MTTKNQLMQYSFDIDKIIQYLERYSQNLNQLYIWDTPEDMHLKKAENIGLMNSTEYEFIKCIENYFERNVQLKKILKEKLNHCTDDELMEDFYEWIICEWGGIRTLKKDELAKEIKVVLEKLQNCGQIDFKRIASISKVLSFMYPEKYIIYDARVAYSLNWIILKSKAGEKFFPIPDSRNSKLAAFDMNSLIRLTNINIFSNVMSTSGIEKRFISDTDKNIFIKDKDAYSVMCKLISAINKELWQGQIEKVEYPYYTEMLLFSIADTVIFRDMVQSCKLMIG